MIWWYECGEHSSAVHDWHNCNPSGKHLPQNAFVLGLLNSDILRRNQWTASSSALSRGGFHHREDRRGYIWTWANQLPSFTWSLALELAYLWTAGWRTIISWQMLMYAFRNQWIWKPRTSMSHHCSGLRFRQCSHYDFTGLFSSCSLCSCIKESKKFIIINISQCGALLWQCIAQRLEKSNSESVCLLHNCPQSVVSGINEINENGGIEWRNSIAESVGLSGFFPSWIAPWILICTCPSRLDKCKLMGEQADIHDIIGQSLVHRLPWKAGSDDIVQHSGHHTSLRHGLILLG